MGTMVAGTCPTPKVSEVTGPEDVAHSQTAAFRRRVRDHMQAPPVVVPGAMPALAVVARMAEAGASAAVILGADGRIAGILTEQDVTRRIAGQKVGTQPVACSISRHACRVPTAPSPGRCRRRTEWCGRNAV